ncbi:bacteriophage CI repressor, partial [Desulfovibrio oxamicus]|nr:bacteriophage CI repressor [Nitratidesulfovibrio oxamicus]
MQGTDITTQQALARVLGVNRSAITQAKNRDAIPQKWILRLSRVYALSPDWLEYGRGTPRPAPLVQAFAAAAHGAESAPSQAVIGHARPVGVAPGRAATLRPSMPAPHHADLPPAVHMVPKVR